jgi:hypothetical protein
MGQQSVANTRATLKSSNLVEYEKQTSHGGKESQSVIQDKTPQDKPPQDRTPQDKTPQRWEGGMPPLGLRGLQCGGHAPFPTLSFRSLSALKKRECF